MSDKSSTLATLSTNIKTGIENRLKDLHTHLPGIIESFDASTQLATVQPAVKRIFKTETGEVEILTAVDLPLLINVPVQFPRGGGFSLTFPVKQGDECLLAFCERSIDEWHEFGTVRKPGARRMHDLSDATAFVGLSSIPNKVPNYDDTNVQIKKDDDSVYVTLKANGDLDGHADGNVNITADGDIIATASGKIDATAASICDITAPTINLNGAVNISGLTTMQASAVLTGTLTNNGVNIGSTHVHTQPNDSGGNTEFNTGVPQ